MTTSLKMQSWLPEIFRPCQSHVLKVFNCQKQGLSLLFSFQVPKFMVFQLPNVSKITVFYNKMQFTVVFDLSQQLLNALDLFWRQLNRLLVAREEGIAVVFVVFHLYTSQGDIPIHPMNTTPILVKNTLLLSYTFSSQFQAPISKKMSPILR